MDGSGSGNRRSTQWRSTLVWYAVVVVAEEWRSPPLRCRRGPGHLDLVRPHPISWFVGRSLHVPVPSLNGFDRPTSPLPSPARWSLSKQFALASPGRCRVTTVVCLFSDVSSGRCSEPRKLTERATGPSCPSPELVFPYIPNACSPILPSSPTIVAVGRWGTNGWTDGLDCQLANSPSRLQH